MAVDMTQKGGEVRRLLEQMQLSKKVSVDEDGAVFHTEAVHRSEKKTGIRHLLP